MVRIDTAQRPSQRKRLVGRILVTIATEGSEETCGVGGDGGGGTRSDNRHVNDLVSVGSSRLESVLNGKPGQINLIRRTLVNARSNTEIGNLVWTENVAVG